MNTTAGNVKSSHHSTVLPALLPTQKLDLSRVRHPAERSFFAVIVFVNLIFGAAVLAIGYYQWKILLILGAVSIGLYILNKISYVLMYWHLYGHSVLVGPAQYPSIYKAVQRACELLDLRPHPKLFVLHGNGLIELFLVKRFTKRGLLGSV